MKKIFLILFVVAAGLFGQAALYAENVVYRQSVINDLNTLDKNIKKWFPRWRVCESDLQMQVYNSFLYRGIDKDLIDFGLVEILAAPKPNNLDAAYQILSITCGETTIAGDQIDSWLPNMLIGYLAGDLHYTDPPGDEIARGDAFFGIEEKDPYVRDYCYTEIPVAVPLSPTSATAILDYLHPTNKQHVFTLSLFEQSIKVGESGFWLNSTVGLDDVGMPFWYAGQNSITLKRPLVENDIKTDTTMGITDLISYYLGFGYRTSTGVHIDGTPFTWVPERVLNSSSAGYLNVGIDFHLPVEGFTEAGISFAGSFPLQSLKSTSVNVDDYGSYINPDVVWVGPLVNNDPNLAFEPVQGYSMGSTIVPIVGSTGKIALFYNWWLNKKKPENYLRVDLGYSFANVTETGLYSTYDPTILRKDENGDPIPGAIDKEATMINYYSPDSDKYFDGLKDYEAEGFEDWIYLKAEYRHQKAYPFGLSAQISGGIFQGRVWLPLFGNWFYLEAKYSTPLHDVRPYELENFYMISPVIRLAI